MTDAKRTAGLPTTVVYRLGSLGSLVTDRFAARIETYGLKPKHAGLMAALSQGAAASQQDLSAKLGVAPSLVVSLADHLEGLGAVQRVRDPQDRRRQVLTLTPHGQALLRDCEATARALDDEITVGLTRDQRTALDQVLGILAATPATPATPTTPAPNAGTY